MTCLSCSGDVTDKLSREWQVWRKSVTEARERASERDQSDQCGNTESLRATETEAQVKAVNESEKSRVRE